ncbi:MAG: hypothetical protein U0175_20320 [Caldilineaceae bacterium]
MPKQTAFGIMNSIENKMEEEMSIQKLEKAKTMASQLAPAEQAELIVWLGNLLKVNLPNPQSEVKPKNSHRRNPNLAQLEQQIKSTPKSGAEIAAMIESGEIDTTAWDDEEIDDPVVWLKELRYSTQIQRRTKARLE